MSFQHMNNTTRNEIIICVGNDSRKTIATQDVYVEKRRINILTIVFLRCREKYERDIFYKPNLKH